MIEAEIVVGEKKDEIARRRPEKFGKIRQRVARLGEDDIAVIARKSRQQVALLRIAGIVAHDDFDIRPGPRAGLSDSGAGQKTGPVGRDQDRELHGPLRAEGECQIESTIALLSDSRRRGNAGATGQSMRTVAKTKAVDSLFHSESPVPHQARSFAALPGPEQAQSLLAEIATAPCRFAPAAADAPLALYGAGDLGRLARDFLKDRGA